MYTFYNIVLSNYSKKYRLRYTAKYNMFSLIKSLLLSFRWLVYETNFTKLSIY